jgi:hypothetical protein
MTMFNAYRFPGHLTAAVLVRQPLIMIILLAWIIVFGACFGIMGILKGFRPLLATYDGVLASCKVVKNRNQYTLRQTFAYFPSNNDTEKRCVVWRLDKYSNFGEALTASNRTVIGSHRQIWLDHHTRSVCYDKAAANAVLYSGVIFTIMGFLPLLLMGILLVKESLSRSVFVGAPNENEHDNNDIELNELDCGLK